MLPNKNQLPNKQYKKIKDMKNNNIIHEPKLLVISAHGIYMIPEFTRLNRYDKLSTWNFTNVSNEALDIVCNDDFENDIFWECVEEILENSFMYYDGIKYTLCLNEDLWAIPETMTEGEYEDFII